MRLVRLLMAVIASVACAGCGTKLGSRCEAAGGTCRVGAPMGTKCGDGIVGGDETQDCTDPNLHSPGGGFCCVPCPSAGGCLLSCGGLTEGAACVEADWRGYQCFNGDCYFDCATVCACVQGIWRCNYGCRSMQGNDPDGGTVPCGTSPKCWSMCGEPP